MTKTIKESLSALIDGETSEIEVHRFLREYDANEDSVKQSWVSYHATRGVVRRTHRQLSSEQHLSLHLRIREAIAKEDAHQISGESSLANGKRSASALTSRYRAPAMGFAMAASLVVAVFAGYQLNEGGDQSSQEIASLPGLPVTVQAVSNDIDRTDQFSVDQPLPTPRNTSQLANTEFSPALEYRELELRELDAEKQQQLREYLRLHDRMSRTRSGTQTVNYNQGKK